MPSSDRPRYRKATPAEWVFSIAAMAVMVPLLIAALMVFVALLSEIVRMVLS